MCAWVYGLGRMPWCMVMAPSAPWFVWEATWPPRRHRMPPPPLTLLLPSLLLLLPPLLHLLPLLLLQTWTGQPTMPCCVLGTRLRD